MERQLETAVMKDKTISILGKELLVALIDWTRRLKSF